MKFLNNILRRQAYWIGRILRRNCILHGAIERLMMKVKEEHDLRNRRRYWELREN